MDNNETDGLRREAGIPAQTSLGGSPAPELDPAEYLSDMDGFDMSEAQKIELLETLWSIMRAFIEMGVDIGAADLCGQILGAADQFPADAPNDVKSSFVKVTTTRSDGKEADTA